MASTGMNTRYCPEPYSFSPPSIVDRLLRPLLPATDNPVGGKPVSPGSGERVASESDTPGSVKIAAVMDRFMLGKFSTCTWFIVLAFCGFFFFFIGGCA